MLPDWLRQDPPASGSGVWDYKNVHQAWRTVLLRNKQQFLSIKRPFLGHPWLGHQSPGPHHFLPSPISCYLLVSFPAAVHLQDTQYQPHLSRSHTVHCYYAQHPPVMTSNPGLKCKLSSHNSPAQALKPSPASCCISSLHTVLSGHAQALLPHHSTVSHSFILYRSF